MTGRKIVSKSLQQFIKNNFAILILILSALYFEVLYIHAFTLFWPSTKFANLMSKNKEINTSRELKILFVADPQLEGYHRYKDVEFIGELAIWDADRYLRKTFSSAVSFVNPDVVIFLGDLFDEGLTSTDKEYNLSLQRFHEIFEISQSTEVIYIAGDNDIGGDGLDQISDHKIALFEKHFSPIKPQTIRFIDFVSLPFHTSVDVKDIMPIVKSKFQVILTHPSLLTSTNMNYLEILSKRINASTVFSGHNHKAKICVCLKCRQSFTFLFESDLSCIRLTRFDDVYEFPIEDGLFMREVQVPTCSYRMGVKDIGFGAAILGENNRMIYSMLWIQQRYIQLFTYLFLTFFIIIFGIYKYMIVRLKTSTSRIFLSFIFIICMYEAWVLSSWIFWIRSI